MSDLDIDPDSVAARLEFNAILENAPMGILLTRGRTMVKANRPCAEMFGYASDELIGRPATIVWPDAERYREFVRRARCELSAGKTYREEAEFVRRDGERFWCRFSAKAIDPRRLEVGALWILEDVGERRRMTMELERRTRELSALFENDAIGIALVAGRRIERCNRRFAAIHGMTCDMLVGQSTRRLYHSDEEYSEIGARTYRELAAGKVHHSEQYRMRSDGSSLWLRMTGSPIGGEGAPLRSIAEVEAGRTVWLMEDIGEEREAEEHARRAFAEQATIFDNAAVGIVFIRNGVVQRCNRKLADLYGYARDELIGRSARCLFLPGDDFIAIEKDMLSTIRCGRTYAGESCAARKDGSRFWVRATGLRVASARDGEDVVWIYEDVSERRAAEEALYTAYSELEQRVEERTADLQRSEAIVRQLNIELEQRVAERTAALSATLADLQQAQADLLQAEKLAALGSLVAGVAHEMNTPIGNAIMTSSTLVESLRRIRADLQRGELRRSTLDEFLRDGRDMVELLNRSCQRSTQLISSFKQVATDRNAEQRRRFGLRELIEDVVATEVVAILGHTFKHTSWRIEIDIPAELLCDSYPDTLSRIVAHLVQNALIHAFEGRTQARLRIAAELVDDRVEMKIADDGRGMDEATLARIFDPFFTTRLGRGGSGLGLTIARNLASGVLGGSLRATSAVGQGACFVVGFPAAAPERRCSGNIEANIGT